MASRSVSDYIAAVEAALTPLHDPVKAQAMAAYMKDHFPFLGIPTPARNAAIKQIAKPAAVDVHAIARGLWQCREREYHYVAVGLLDRMSRTLDPAKTLSLIEALALKHSWWDTVDGLAKVGSDILKRQPDQREIVWRWSAHPSFWVNRLAILHQKSWNEQTDEATLFKVCLAHAHSQEFFVRKAIGWALRDYAWTRPEAVRAFVEANRAMLSPLTVREALKNI